MAGKSDPSIYDERTTIGSSDDLDEYGVWVKSAPQDLSSSLPEIEELPEFDSDFSEDIPDIGAPVGDDFEMPDFSDAEDVSEIKSVDSVNFEFEEIPENSELPEGPAPVSVDRDGFVEVSMDDFLDTSNINTPDSIDFGDLDSSVSDMEPIDDTEDFSASSAGHSSEIHSSEAHSSGTELSTQLLQRIADELSSIKKEISSLKTELSLVRGEIKSTESAESTGFFDEEDDEKIALTGDELDNILNTANFTEETGSGEGFENDLSFESDVPILDETGIVGEKTETTVDINFDEELSELDSSVKTDDDIKIPDADDFDVSLDLSPDLQSASSELDVLREEGALPITEAPEDTSFL